MKNIEESCKIWSNYIMNMAQAQKLQGSVCPECDTPIKLPRQLVIGKIVECPACGTQCELVALNPIKLAPLEEEK